MQDLVWICTHCSIQQTEVIKLLKKYNDDIICAVPGELDNNLKFTISLHKNLLFIFEKTSKEKDSTFLDINVTVSNESDINNRWYQKPTDTGIKLNFCSCASL